jgi:hypothetical protein
MNLNELKELEHQLLICLGNATVIASTAIGNNEIEKSLEKDLTIITEEIQRRVRKFEPRITEVRFVKDCGQTVVMARLGEQKVLDHLFKFYDDEWSVSAEELMGLTKEAAVTLARKRDIAYIQS